MGLKRNREIVEQGLALMAIDEGATAGQVPTVQVGGGGVTFETAGGASFPPEWTIGAGGSLTIDNVSTPNDPLLVLNGANNQAGAVLEVTRGGVAIDADGLDTELLTVLADAGQTATIFAIRAASGSEYLVVDPVGGVQVSADPDGGDSSLNITTTALTFEDHRGETMIDVSADYISLGKNGKFTAGDGDLYIGVAPTDTIGFYGSAGVAQQTGVAVSDAAIHAALVALGLITA